MKYSDPVQIFNGGKLVAKSRNLRGLLDYARNHSRVKRVELQHEQSGEGAYLVEFNNGAHSRGMFADYRLMVTWFETRKRFSAAWCLCEITIVLHG